MSTGDAARRVEVEIEAWVAARRIGTQLADEDLVAEGGK
jgi:hypothetical protein